MAEWLRRQPGGIALTVRLTPKSARDCVEGVGAGADGATHLKARVRSIPEKGKANAALETLIAGWLGVPKSSVSILAGHTGRLKSVSVAGDPDALTALAKTQITGA